MQKKFEISAILTALISIPIILGLLWVFGFAFGFFAKGFCYATRLCGM